MRKTVLRYSLAAPALALILGGGLFAAAQAQAPAPAAALARTADGVPDFSGVWGTGRGGARPADPRGICVGFNCGPNAVPAGQPRTAPTGGPAAAPAARPAANFPKYKPEFLAKVAELNKNQVKEDPALRCGNPGLPRIGPPNKIIQTKNELTMLYDDLNGSFWRVIPIGAAHNKDAEEAALGGSSVGKWEGDKLVIETIAFSDNTWLTDNGAFHSYNMKTVEELRPNGRGIEYKLTVYDPDVLAEPWVKVAALNNVGGVPGQPVPCVEKSIDAMVGTDSYHPNARW